MVNTTVVAYTYQQDGGDSITYFIAFDQGPPMVMVHREKHLPLKTGSQGFGQTV